YVMTLLYEVAAHLRAVRVMTLVRDRVVLEAGRNERFALVPAMSKATAAQQARARPLVLIGYSRLDDIGGSLCPSIRDEAAFVSRSESPIANDGEIDLLGFSEKKTLPVLK